MIHALADLVEQFTGLIAMHDTDVEPHAAPSLCMNQHRRALHRQPAQAS